MPVMNDYEATAAIRSFHAWDKHDMKHRDRTTYAERETVSVL